MRNWSTRLWTAAIALSLLLHGGAAAILSDRGERVEVAGGEPVDIAILGNAFEDAVAAGEIAD
jgi:periplasmic protein TonB